ncbi:DUF2306 domain-containing protein [Oceaniglobus roseus]|uniref:DUF2306 domain-containing protein n=1 Tax=Oceaniglobus roseus TaxID=1737570 RepID=UPI000C7E9604|nr:DUF2306 domain-containing protein [Kandeliimicrobium roseum]
MAARRLWPQSVALALLWLLALGFVLYAAGFGWRGLTRDLSGQTYLYTHGGWAANLAVFGHMLAGAAITCLAPLQVSAALRRRFPALHRGMGRVLVAGGMLAGLGGLAYIALRGTIGGPWMDFGFALYGVCMVVAAVQAFRFARRRDIARHRRWALRLFVLAMASWLFRVHYGLWFLATGGLGSTEGLTGPFDRVQVLAFFVPYLVLLELWLRRHPEPGAA